MDRHLSESTYDRELDAIQQASTRPTEPIDRYQRLVVNPLLAVSCVVLAVIVFRAALRWENLAIFLAGLGLLAVSFLLTQFHCLDCGSTDWFLNWRRHACPPVVARWRSGRMECFRLPAFGTQIRIWFHVLASATVLALILFVLSR